MKPAETTPPSTRSGSPYRAGSQICPESPARTSSPTRLESAHAEQGHARMTLGFLEKVTFLSDKGFVALNGDNLDVPDLVAVANFGCGTSLLRDDIVGKVNDSIAVLKRKLSQEELVYGVNTGFGGSADVRTSKHVALQQGLVQLLNSGVLTNEDTMPASQASSLNGQSASMPTSWARGLMLARLNSIIRGHSAVSLEIIDTIVTFLQKDMTPVIPVRGSISASGDLIPLSYLAGCIQGSTDIYMRVGNLNSKVVPAAVALKEAGIQPIILGAKEGLGLLNGTAASVAVASLAIYESNQIALLSQILTAMGCEALKGTAESFHAFIAKTRPHKGQIEAASNILGFLSSSGLVSGFDGENKEVEGLAQDRYALRTSSQWIGPQLEDLMLATEQVTVELNSTTDNPLIDVEGDTILHGGNFQAASVTSAMEKTRLSVQMLAKMLFAQCTEIINPALNRGLPPNLCADDPSLSFTMKGVDISMAAYYSEIAFLSNPVSTHVQSAEMHNQALNSLALISARYTLQVVEIANMMCAAYLTMVCQALDLRVLQQRFIEALRPVIVVKTKSILEALIESSDSERSGQAIFVQVLKTWNSSTTMDLAERCDKTAEAASAILFSEMTGNSESEFKCSTQAVFSGIKTWKEEISTTLKELYEQTREEMFKDHKDITPRQLGQGSRKLYLFVRGELKIPFHRGLVEEPTHELGADQQASFPTAERRTIGSLIGIVYEAIRDGSIGKPLMEAVRENWK